MADEISVQEASDYLGLPPEQVILLAEAHEIRGRQEGQDWVLNWTDVVAYRARRLAQENAMQGVVEERNPMIEDEHQTMDEKEYPAGHDDRRNLGNQRAS